MRLLTLILTALLLTACGEKLEQGQVVRKVYEPARQWVQIVPIVISTGKTTSVMMIPMVHYDDEDFVVYVRGRLKDGKQVTRRWYYPNRGSWRAVKVGDYVSRTQLERVGGLLYDEVKRRRKS